MQAILLRILPLAMQLFILAIMLRRKLRSEFPVFFQYILFNSVALCLAVIFHSIPIRQPWLTYVDWSTSLISMLLAFGVLYEVFVNVLKPYSALIDLGRMLFRWAAVFVLVAAFITAFATISAFATNKPLGSLGSFDAARLLIDHSLRVMQCGLLLLLLVFEKRLGLSWRSRGMAIALGFGSSAAAALTASLMKGFFAAATPRYDLELVNGAFYLGVTLFWAVSLLLPESPHKNVLHSPNRVIVQRWNDVLTNTSVTSNHERPFSSVDPFIPGVERAVERVLARKHVS
jgi:hypothetical protein